MVTPIVSSIGHYFMKEPDEASEWSSVRSKHGTSSQRPHVSKHLRSASSSNTSKRSLVEAKKATVRAQIKLKAAKREAELQEREVQLENEQQIQRCQVEVDIVKAELDVEEDSDNSQVELSESDEELESKGLEELQWESQNDRVQRLLEHTTASDDPNPLSRLGIELAKQKKPSIKVFNGSAIKFVAFKASINRLRSKGLYDEDELLVIVLDHVGGEAEKAIREILPGSGQFKRAMEILEQRFGNNRVIVNAINLAALKSHPVVQEKRADQLRSLSNGWFVQVIEHCS